MSREAISMANQLLGAVLRSEVNAQYHWANLIMMDAVARWAKGPEVTPAMKIATSVADEMSGWTPEMIAKWRASALPAEDAIDEATR